MVKYRKLSYLKYDISNMENAKAPEDVSHPNDKKWYKRAQD